MKKYIIGLFSVGLALTNFSCRQDFDEINTSSNQPSNVTTYGVFNSATKELADATRGSFSSARFFLPWMQYSAQVNYTSEDRYRFREEVNQSLYRDFYRVAQDFKSIIDVNTNPDTRDLASQYGNNDNQVAVSRIMLSYIFANLVETYGDIPYYSYGSDDAEFQALQSETISSPAFANQQKVYTDILKELKEAAEMINVNERVFTGEGDQIFNSDASKWKKFANSLRLRYANRVKGIVSGAEQHITEAIASGVMESNEDNAAQPYSTNSELASPIYRAFFVDRRNDFGIGSTFVNLLKDYKDPRLFYMARPKNVPYSSTDYEVSKDFDNYIGMPYGVQDSQTADQFQAGVSTFGSYILNATYSEMFMEYAEVAFLLSENNGWNEEDYKKGIVASMQRWGVEGSDADTYLANVAPASQESVLTQKYIALFMQPVEAWSEYRRTGYPNVLLLPGQTANYNVPNKDGQTTYVFESAIGGLTDVPARVTYPVNLATLNADNYAAAQQAIGGDNMNTKLFWDRN